MAKLNAFLNILMGSFFGVFLGSAIANRREFLAMPEIYEARPAPWYCYGALQGFLLFAAASAICLIVKWIIRRKAKPSEPIIFIPSAGTPACLQKMVYRTLPDMQWADTRSDAGVKEKDESDEQPVRDRSGDQPGSAVRL